MGECPGHQTAPTPPGPKVRRWGGATPEGSRAGGLFFKVSLLGRGACSELGSLFLRALCNLLFPKVQGLRGSGVVSTFGQAGLEPSSCLGCVEQPTIG
jgi:hypothetical protein